MKLALDVIEGCDYLHSRSILHGNLAARNIFIEKQHGRNGAVHYNAKVSDFTVVRLAPATISGKCYMRVSRQVSHNSLYFIKEFHGVPFPMVVVRLTEVYFLIYVGPRRSY